MKTSDTEERRLISRLYTAYYVQILNYISSRVNDVQIGEDLTQDVWMRVLQTETPISESGALSYLYTIARNIVNDYLRSYYTRQHAQDEIKEYQKEEDTINAEHEMIAADLALFERKRVERLPAQRRIIYTMCRYEEKSVADIAEELALSFRTVENHLRLGRKDVREYMTAIA